jgi:hypothetical protein
MESEILLGRSLKQKEAWARGKEVGMCPMCAEK